STSRPGTRKALGLAGQQLLICSAKTTTGEVGPDSPNRSAVAGRSASLKQPSLWCLTSQTLGRRNAAHDAEHPARPGPPEWSPSTARPDHPQEPDTEKRTGRPNAVRPPVCVSGGVYFTTWDTEGSRTRRFGQGSPLKQNRDRRGCSSSLQG